MRGLTSFVLVAAVAAAVGLAAGRALRRPGAPAPSPYADQRASPVRGLSTQEVDDLLAGRGAGFARTAELNGYPGPRHALDLGGELALTSVQRAEAQRLFDRMSDEARRLGREIVERERAFSASFAARRVTSEGLRAAADTLGTLYGRLRAVHLDAHLALTARLAPEQIRRYDQLRGYGHGNGDSTHLHTP